MAFALLRLRNSSWQFRIGIQAMNKHPATQLFTVRLWQENMADARGDFRVKVQHLLSKETKYFSDPQKMVEYMLAKYQEVDKETQK